MDNQDYISKLNEILPEYVDNIKKDLYSGIEAQNWKKINTIKYIDKIYEFSGFKKPCVIVANNPKEYRKFFDMIFNGRKNKKILPIIEKILKQKNINGHSEGELTIEKDLRNINYNPNNSIKVSFDYLFLTSEYTRVYLTWYHFMKSVCDIQFQKQKELDWLSENVKNSSISRCYFTENICLVLRMPSKIIRNDIGFHSAFEPSIQFDGNDGYYYLNGRRIPDWVFENYNNKTLTKDMFIEEKNEDIKAGIITLIKEREGNEGLLKFLDAKIVDEKNIYHSNDYSEILRLYKTNESYDFLVNRHGENNNPYSWLEMSCPSTGQIYLIDTCPTFNDVLECAKWHRPKFVPNSVPYIWQSAN